MFLKMKVRVTINTFSSLLGCFTIIYIIIFIITVSIIFLIKRQISNGPLIEKLLYNVETVF